MNKIVNWNNNNDNTGKFVEVGTVRCVFGNKII